MRRRTGLSGQLYPLLQHLETATTLTAENNDIHGSDYELNPPGAFPHSLEDIVCPPTNAADQQRRSPPKVEPRSTTRRKAGVPKSDQHLERLEILEAAWTCEPRRKIFTVLRWRH
jgi:hypothetical protein